MQKGSKRMVSERKLRRGTQPAAVSQVPRVVFIFFDNVGALLGLRGGNKISVVIEKGVGSTH